MYHLSAIQVRYGGAKGVLAVDPYLADNTILLRKSMVKYKCEYRDLEILDRNKYRAGYLNRQIILLLVSLGVDEKLFEDIQNEYLQNLENCSLKDASIFKYFNANYDGELMSVKPITHLIRKLVNMEIEFQNEPFVKGIINTLKTRGYQTLRKKANILVPKATRLIGVCDEYSILAEDEVYCAVCED